jgi:hypothetical protein
MPFGLDAPIVNFISIMIGGFMEEKLCLILTIGSVQAFLNKFCQFLGAALC